MFGLTHGHWYTRTIWLLSDVTLFTVTAILTDSRANLRRIFYILTGYNVFTGSSTFFVNSVRLTASSSKFGLTHWKRYTRTIFALFNVALFTVAAIFTDSRANLRRITCILTSYNVFTRLTTLFVNSIESTRDEWIIVIEGEVSIWEKEVTRWILGKRWKWWYRLSSLKCTKIGRK